MYHMTTFPEFAPTLNELVDKRYSMIQCYLSKELKVYEIIQKFGVTSPDFYKYLNRFRAYGKAGLQNIKRGARVPHNKTSPITEAEVISWHKKYPSFSSYELNNLLNINARTIQRIFQRKKLKKTYKPKSEKKKLLEKLKKEIARKKETQKRYQRKS